MVVRGHGQFFTSAGQRRASAEVFLQRQRLQLKSSKDEIRKEWKESISDADLSDEWEISRDLLKTNWNRGHLKA